MEKTQERWVLQLCHGYDMPFHDVARQYTALFTNSGYKIATVFLTGKKNDNIAHFTGSDDVIFLENTSGDLRGLKRKQIRQVRQICLERNYAFCIAHRFKPIYIATHVSDLFVIGVHHAFGGYRRWMRRIYAQSKQQNLALVGVSDAVRDNIRRSLPKFSQERIVTLYNRIDTCQQKSKLVSREQAREVLDLPADAFIFGNVGRLHPDKDQATLLKAFASISRDHPKARLVIMGKGRLEAALKDQSKILGISDKTIFTGAIPEAAKYFKAFDSFVLSSDHEPFGMVLLEAMVSGLPVISSNTGGAPEVIGDAGLIFKSGVASDLAEKMREIIVLKAQKKSELIQLMNDRLNNVFSDEAVQKVFWSFPFVKVFAVKANKVDKKFACNSEGVSS